MGFSLPITVPQSGRKGPRVVPRIRKGPLTAQKGEEASEPRGPAGPNATPGH